jgi:CRP-like cAMP-binding protein
MAAPMSKAVMKEWLRSVPLFVDLSEAELETVAGASRSTASRKGARVFEEGAAADCCYVLTSGSAKLVLAAEGGTEIILGVLQPRELVGEVALLDGSTRSADLITTEECHFIRIPASTFDTLRRNFQFERRIVAHAMSLLRSANDQVRGTAALPSLSKVAWCLARLARREGTRRGRAIVLPKRPHHELAEMAGLSRETVTRALATLKRRNCLSWNDETIALDIDAIQRVLHRDLQVG